MYHSRRSFLARAAGLVALGGATSAARPQEPRADAFADLKSMTGGVRPLELADYQDRIERACRLMADQKIDLLFLAGGTTLEYFGGFRWGLSERLFAMLIPARGDVAYLCPKFEEGRARELIRFGADVRTWDEDESPYAKVKAFLAERKIGGGTVALEASVREFVGDGLRKTCAPARFVNGEGISNGCRMIKTGKELAFMELACQITQKAYAAAFRTLREGMTQPELMRAVSAAHTRLGAAGGGFVTFGPNSAFPHGSRVERRLAKGDVVLIDGGCRVEGYESDITRTVVFGSASDKVRRVWETVKRAQDAALAAARPGVACEAVDAAARKVITDAGYGPDYKFFTHRLGHGIGMDGHEYPYLVRGNKLPLQPGMTFSDEPGIYLVGEFGVRIEDVMCIGQDRARLFGSPATALEVY
jgi:Xaa-Pro dipeptidase